MASACLWISLRAWKERQGKTIRSFSRFLFSVAIGQIPFWRKRTTVLLVRPHTASLAKGLQSFWPQFAQHCLLLTAPLFLPPPPPFPTAILSLLSPSPHDFQPPTSPTPQFCPTLYLRPTTPPSPSPNPALGKPTHQKDIAHWACVPLECGCRLTVKHSYEARRHIQW